MNTDQGVVYVLMEHFVQHLHPRALQIEKDLDEGLPLSIGQIDHVAQVLEESRLLRPLIDRHPEHRELAARVIGLYTSIAQRAWKSETSNPVPKAGA